MRKLFGLLFLVAFLISCRPSSNQKAESNELAQNSKNTTEKIDKDLRKLIKEATIRFRTKDIAQTNELINKSLKGFGAYISEDNNFNYSNEIGYDLTIRVPAENFDSLVNFILTKTNIKELDNKSTQIKDVTEEFIDVEARLKIKKESEQKLSDLLKQAKNLSETLEIQKQLTDLRADIESTEGRLKYLSNQVDYSTIHLSFYENIKYSKRFFGDFFDAIKDGFQLFLHVITLLTYLWVVILVFFIGRYGYKYYRKHKKQD